ncbi:MAG: hypothetical protein WBV19_04220, partial [Candidatus Macondimonas sp.]
MNSRDKGMLRCGSGQGTQLQIMPDHSVFFQQIPDFGQQLFLRRRTGGLGRQAQAFIQPTQRQHNRVLNHGGGNQKRHQRRHKIAVTQGNFAALVRGCNQHDLAAKFDAARCQPNQRIDKGFSELRDQIAEGGADDDADGKIHHVAAQNELPEIPRHIVFPL